MATSAPKPEPAGLDSATAAQRLLQDGPNELGLGHRRTLLDMVWDVAREPMFVLLLAAGAIYLVMGDLQGALVLLGFVFIIMGVTVLQEQRSDRALAALRDLSSPRAQVVRDGVLQRIAGREVVPGDLLLLAEGDRVAADGTVQRGHEFATDESMLSGESVPLSKADGERVFAGTLVVSGQARVVVSATGAHTEMGRIGRSLEDIGLQSSPLRDEMARLTRRLVFAGLALCLLLVGLLWALRGDALQALLAGITLAMGLLPQELPVIMVVFLALAARRLAAHQVLTRRLNAIETLGQTTVLCVDKTGTLTLNQMAVAALVSARDQVDLRGWKPQGPEQSQGQTATALSAPLQSLLKHAALASETQAHDPMEVAIAQAALAYGPTTAAPATSSDLVREYELSPALLAMSHVWRTATDDVVATKGAPEAVATLCHLSEAEALQVNQQAAALAQQGLRVLGVACGQHPRGEAWPAQQTGFRLSWLGLVGLADPLREDVPAAVAQCQRAGIRVVMITGDHPQTAWAMALQAGIAASEQATPGAMLTGTDLAAMSPTRLTQQVKHVNVFARVQPQQKLALVQALKASGEVVAMTGDGVNDAPALKAAHIGIAMGQRGTDVAREAASLVLLEDNFSAIVGAIARGRRTFAKLRQAMVYILAVHVPIVVMALLPALLGWPLILTPLHIAFLELLIDPACSLVFEAEGEPEGQVADGSRADPVMARAPRRASEPLLSKAHVGLSMVQGALVAGLSVGSYLGCLALGYSTGAAGTVAFMALVSANACLIFPSRSSAYGWASVWRGISATSAWVLAGTFTALAVVTAWPVVAQAFGFTRLPPLLWLAALASGLLMAMPFQAAKRWVFRPRSP